MCATCQGLTDSSFFDTREKNRRRECGNWKKKKKTYDPCTYLALSESSMAERVKQAVIELKGVVTTLFNE